jgi:hypothetical protein
VVKGIAPAEGRLNKPQADAVWKSVSDLFDKHNGLTVDEMFLRGYNAALGDAMKALRPLWGEGSTPEDNDLRNRNS